MTASSVVKYVNRVYTVSYSYNNDNNNCNNITEIVYVRCTRLVRLQTRACKTSRISISGPRVNAWTYNMLLREPTGVKVRLKSTAMDRKRHWKPGNKFCSNRVLRLALSASRVTDINLSIKSNRTSLERTTPTRV